MGTEKTGHNKMQFLFPELAIVGPKDEVKQHPSGRSSDVGDRAIQATTTRHKEVILGNPPAKSNGYRIIILKNKDKTKQHPSLTKSAELKAYEKSFALQCKKYRNAMINEPFKIEVDVYFPRRNSDLDNSLKVILDCLQQAKAITNDNLCDGIIANKFIDKEHPRIEFTLKPESGSILKHVPII